VFDRFSRFYRIHHDEAEALRPARMHQLTGPHATHFADEIAQFIACNGRRETPNKQFD
jgi:hypothetical protein